MKLSAILVALALSGCVTETVVVEKNKPQVYTRPDPAAAMMLKCDALGFSRGSDGHRLCVMRGVDRLGVQPGSIGYAPIQILPYAYPPLAPSHGVTILK